jgi:uncharacterized protein (DUF3084 family)
MKSAKQLLIGSCLIALPFGLIACNATLPQIAETGASVAGAAGYTNQAQLVRAIKDALELGSNRAATSLSATGGYANNPLYRIELPAELQPIASKLRQYGLGGQLDKVESLMNQGAEKAAVEAKAVFVDAVRNISAPRPKPVCASATCRSSSKTCNKSVFTTNTNKCWAPTTCCRLPTNPIWIWNSMYSVPHWMAYSNKSAWKNS